MASAPACSTRLAVPFSTLNNTAPLPDKRPFPNQVQTIGDHIKQARLQRKMLIKDVIAALQIDRETLRGWERGTTEPYVTHYPAIVQFLGYYPFQLDTETLGGRIKSFRYLNGLSQDKLAALLGTNRSTLWFWESNTRSPVPKTLIAIEKLLATNPVTK